MDGTGPGGGRLCSGASAERRRDGTVIPEARGCSDVLVRGRTVQTTTWGCADGVARVTDREGTELWAGQPRGAHVVGVWPLPPTSDALILLRWEKRFTENQFRNLLRIQPDGRVVWAAELPSTDADMWVEAGVVAGRIRATSWTGFTVDIDPATGRLGHRTYCP
jgi:outer membrane protein assembly factor BamB